MFSNANITARFGFVLTLLFISAASINGVEPAPTRNGFWWLGLDGMQRLMFMQGYVDGVSRGDQLAECTSASKR